MKSAVKLTTYFETKGHVEKEESGNFQLTAPLALGSFQPTKPFPLGDWRMCNCVPSPAGCHLSQNGLQWERCWFTQEKNVDFEPVGSDYPRIYSINILYLSCPALLQILAELNHQTAEQILAKYNEKVGHFWNKK